MGRSAKYLTNEERLRARRARRAARALLPDVQAAKKLDNRRHYEKKRGLKLLKEPTLAVAEPIRVLAAAELSSATHSNLFRQFLEGRDSMGLDELDIEEEDFEALTGLPPYPKPIASMPSFRENWPKLSAAMHGYATRRYLTALENLTTSSLTQREFILIYNLLQHRKRLEFLYETSKKTYQQYSQLGLHAEEALARHNMIWYCRLMEYNREDIETLKEGYGRFIRAVSERKWALGRIAQDV